MISVATMEATCASERPTAAAISLMTGWRSTGLTRVRCCARTGNVATAEALVAKRYGGRLVELRRAEVDEVLSLEKAALIV